MIMGLDVGGSSIKWGVFKNGNGLNVELMKSGSISSEQLPPDDLVSMMIKLIKQGQDEFSIERCGVGFPSVVSNEGYVHIAPNLHKFENVDLLNRLKKEINIPVQIDNDANVAALAELATGAAKDKENFIYVTLGTGIGGAIIINRKLFKGDNSGAGEIGYTTIDKNAIGIGLKENRIGILEEFIGRHQFLKKTKQIVGLYPDSNLNGIDFDVKEISEQAVLEDNAAVEAVSWYGKVLGTGLASVMNFLDIKTVVVGGGISNLPEQMYKTAYETIRKRALPSIASDFKLLKAKYSNEAGIYGAGVLSIMEEK